MSQLLSDKQNVERKHKKIKDLNHTSHIAARIWLKTGKSRWQKIIDSPGQLAGTRFFCVRITRACPDPVVIESDNVIMVIQCSIVLGYGIGSGEPGRTSEPRDDRVALKLKCRASVGARTDYCALSFSGILSFSRPSANYDDNLLNPSFSADARHGRIVIPGVPHHVTQRGILRQRTFFEEGDYALYLDLLAESSARAGEVENRIEIGIE